MRCRCLLVVGSWVNAARAALVVSLLAFGGGLGATPARAAAPVPGQVSLYTAINNPRGIVKRPDGALWYTNSGSNRIGRLSPSGEVVEYGAAAVNRPTGIAVGSDDALLFANGTSIGRITTSGDITTFTTGVHTPGAIAAGPDDALWFTDGSNRIS